MNAEAIDLVKTTLSIVEIAERLREAASVVQRLPIGAGTRPAGFGTAYPAIVRDVAEAYGYGEALAPRLRPTAEEIGRADQAIAWLWWLEAEERRIVWARANRVTWRWLERKDPAQRTERTLRKVYNEALEEIAGRLSTRAA